ncbi:hypothetical protein BDR05DRAFT_976805 [Suillus weaverae]|nr:hypothetical protein BDR05DRAFT_976805 [Suillus weaverae]
MDPKHNLPDLPYTPIEHSTQLQVQQQQPSPSSLGYTDNGGRPQTQLSATEKPLLGNDSSEGHSSPVPRAPPATRSRDGHMMLVSGQAPVNTSGLGWMVPVDEKPHVRVAPRRTIGERLDPTITNAERERAQYATKGFALNIAIGLQVLLGALTTGLGAALTGKQVGGMSTLVASYLARTRGSNEPELSITRVKDLDQFLRDCLAFKMDHGHEYGTPENGLNNRLEHLRKRFEELLGNADGQRKLSPPV